MMSAEPGTRVVLGMQGLQGVHYAHRGIGRYAGAYVNALCAEHPDRVARIDLHPALPPPPRLTPSGAGLAASAPERRPENGGALAYHVLAPFQRSPIGELWPRWARAREVALVLTLYDLIPLRHPARYLADDRDRAAYVSRLAFVREADALLAISDAAAADAVALLGVDERRVHVVGAANPEPAAPPASNGTLPEGARDGAILFVTGDDWRKNTARLVDAYALLAPELRARHQLAVVGSLPTHEREAIAARAAVAGAADDVLLTGEISDAELAALRRASALATFPSHDEGFGLPVLEALHEGLPVVVSDIPALRELVREPAARFDPGETGEITAALQRGLTDTALRERLRAAAPGWAAEHTWERVVERSLVAYDAAASERARRPRERRSPARQRERLQLITPLPPTPSGVATYSARLAAALAELVDVDVYEEEAPPVSRAALAPGVRTQPVSWFPWHRELAPGALPPVHVLGNSPFHLGAWAQLVRHGGDVLLHDARLTGLYESLDAVGALGPGGFPAALRRIEGVTADAGSVAEACMVGEVVDHARRVYVHTPAARALVLARRPDREADVRVLPFAMPPVAEPGGREGAPVIASFGYLHRPDRLFDAVAAVLRTHPEARAVLAGGAVEQPDLERLRSIAQIRGLGERLALPGWLDDDAYRALLARATVAVQLRTHANGEMSASIADCLAAGVPTDLQRRRGFDRPAGGRRRAARCASVA